MKKQNKKGFTLVEVIVVLVILAILIAIAVPSVMKYIDDAKDAQVMAQAKGTIQEVELLSTKMIAKQEYKTWSDFNDGLNQKLLKEGYGGIVNTVDYSNLNEDEWTCVSVLIEWDAKQVDGTTDSTSGMSNFIDYSKTPTIKSIRITMALGKDIIESEKKTFVYKPNESIKLVS